MKKRRRSISFASGRNFIATGWGRYGPYITGTRRIRKQTYLKTSVGFKGLLIGIKNNLTNRVSCTVGYNLTSNRPFINAKKRANKSK